MTDSSGNLSVDFLVGFTIFMVAFIWVATLVPNLFLGLSAHGIDFDAVAYRTGVILAEDPGATPDGSPWELQPDTGKDNIERFGLAVSKDTPNVLSKTKVDRFFNTTAFTYPDDYRPRTIFGDYPYQFNISLHVVGESATRYIGNVTPDGSYGYIRREVKIKGLSNATINQGTIQKFHFNNTGYDGNVTFHDFSMVINTSKLLHGNVTNPVTNPNNDVAYNIDPRNDRIVITIEDLDQKPPQPSWPNSVGLWPTVNLTNVKFTQTRYGFPGLFPMGADLNQNFIYVDGSLTPSNPPVTINKNVSFVFDQGFFSDADDTGAIFINLTFGVDTHSTNPLYPLGMEFLNTSGTQPFDYNYYPTNVTQPVLNDAVMEVAVW
jgi:hypothetical protein